MKKIDNIIGGLGLLLVVAALIWYSITRLWEIYHWIFLVLGLIGAGYFLYIYFSKRDKKISSRSFKQGSNILVQVLIFLAIVVMLAFITTRQHYRSDLTSNNLYSLSDQTEKLLNNLDRDVEIKAFFKPADQNRARDLLDEYSYRSGSLNFELIDPDEEPNRVKQYGVNAYNSLVVESGVKRELITELNETNITNAIIKVTREQDKAIYFLTGHGERSIGDDSPQGLKMATDAIKKENHLVQELNLASSVIL